MSHDFVFSNQGLVLLRVFFFRLLRRTQKPPLIFFADFVLLGNFKSAGKASALFSLKHSLIEVVFFVNSFGRILNTNLGNSLFGVDRAYSEAR